METKKTTPIIAPSKAPSMIQRMVEDKRAISHYIRNGGKISDLEKPGFKFAQPV